mgnify:CR=1 FL=1
MMRGAGALLLLLVALSAPASEPRLLPELRSHEIAAGAFTQRRELPDLERAIESRGRFVYHRERGLYWAVEAPVASELVIDATGVYQQGERVEGAGALAAVRPLFRGLFGGELENLREDFRIERLAPESGWEVVLTPRGGALAGAIERIVLAGGERPRRVMIAAADGSRTVLEFSEVDYPSRAGEAARRAFDRVR